MNTIESIQVTQNESRVQRAFNNAAFFWLDRNEFPLADFLHSCTTHFLLRPDFCNEDAEFILKWLEQQRRNPKSNLNKTLRQNTKLGNDSRELIIARNSLKAFMNKPTIKLKAKPASSSLKKTTKPAATQKVTKKVKPSIKVKSKQIKVKAKVTKKVIAKKPVTKAKKSRKIVKASLYKKVKTTMKRAFLMKAKSKKRRAA